jgi:hemoglobin
MRRFLIRSVTSLLAMTFLAQVGRADQGSLAPGDLDVRIDKALYDTINAGLAAYNRNDVAGCSRIYQGALIAIGPFLGHRPDVMATVQKGLTGSEAPMSEVQRAFALRTVLDEVRAKVTTKSLWTRLGGEPSVKAVVHDFVAKAASDPNVDFTRGGKYPLDAPGVAHLEQLIVELVGAVTGGPLKYTGRDMKSSHAGMAITDAQFAALAGDLIEVLKSYKVPQKEIDELVGIIATTKKDIVEAPKPYDPTSLWARLGGKPAVTAVVHDFVAKAASDPKVDFTRGGKFTIDAVGVAHLEILLVEQISSVTGGPLPYTGRDMKSSHAGMAITDAQFAALAGDLIEVLKTYKVPQKEIDELVGIIATTKKDIVEAP